MRRLRYPDMDVYASPEAPFRDDHLRDLVDALPGLERHAIERVFFGQATKAEAAEEWGCSAETISAAIRRGTEMLRMVMLREAVQEED